jgi:hypothetical protein
MSTGRLIIGLLFIVFGLGALLSIDIGRFFWPLLLIFVGIRLLWRDSFRVGEAGEPTASREDFIEYSAVFAPIERKIITNNFTGGKIDVVFGGGVLDLSEAKMRNDQTARLEVNAVFGGLKIIVPPTWNIVSHLTGVAGGFRNMSRSPEKGKEHGHLILKGAAVFGGGEVVNG